MKMVEKFELGKYYRFTKSIEDLKRTEFGMYLYEDKMKVLDGKPHKYIDLFDNLFNFEGQKHHWKYDPEHFEEAIHEFSHDQIIDRMIIDPSLPKNTFRILNKDGTYSEYTIGCDFTKEEKNMELKDIKKSNLKEAQKQYNEERKNAEIEYAKEQLTRATDEIDKLDRKIKQLEEDKKPWQEIIDAFGK